MHRIVLFILIGVLHSPLVNAQVRDSQPVAQSYRSMIDGIMCLEDNPDGILTPYSGYLLKYATAEFLTVLCSGLWNYADSVVWLYDSQSLVRKKSFYTGGKVESIDYQYDTTGENIAVHLAYHTRLDIDSVINTYNRGLLNTDRVTFARGASRITASYAPDARVNCISGTSSDKTKCYKYEEQPQQYPDLARIEKIAKQEGRYQTRRIRRQFNKRHYGTTSMRKRPKSGAYNKMFRGHSGDATVCRAGTITDNDADYRKNKFNEYHYWIDTANHHYYATNKHVWDDVTSSTMRYISLDEQGEFLHMHFDRLYMGLGTDRSFYVERLKSGRYFFRQYKEDIFPAISKNLIISIVTLGNGYQFKVVFL